MRVQLKTITPDAEVNIVEIARVSSSRKDKSEAPEGLINYLIKNKHWSPFQHSYMTVEIETSKAIAIQYLRHLSFTFQEFSQRYAVVSEVEDIEFRLQAEKNRQSSTDVVGIIKQSGEEFGNGFYVELDEAIELHSPIGKWLYKVADHLEATLGLYQEGIELGLAKECVRSVLPMATKTTLYMTGSVRSWIHLMEVRLDEHAQKEARLVAEEIRKIFIEQLPIISKARGYV